MIATCDSAISDGAWPAPAICTSRASPFASSIVPATCSGKIRELSPRTSSTGQRTRYHAPQKKRPVASGTLMTRAIFGS